MLDFFDLQALFYTLKTALESFKKSGEVISVNKIPKNAVNSGKNGRQNRALVEINARDQMATICAVVLLQRRNCKVILCHLHHFHVSHNKNKNEKRS